MALFLLGLGPSTVLGQFRDGNENSQTVVTAQGALGWGLDLLSLYSDFLSEPFPPAMSVFSICKIRIKKESNSRFEIKHILHSRYQFLRIDHLNN